MSTEDEVRTRRLVVLDRQDRERIVGEVVDGVAEVRMNLPAAINAPRTGLLLFTHPGDGAFQFGPAIGVQLWVDGDAVMELTLGRDDSGGWTPGVMLENRG